MSQKSKAFILQDSLLCLFITMVSVELVWLMYTSLVTIDEKCIIFSHMIQDQTYNSLINIERNCDVICPPVIEEEPSS